MSADLWVSRVALGAIPALGLLLYLVRSPSPKSQDESGASPDASASAAVPIATTLATSASKTPSPEAPSSLLPRRLAPIRVPSPSRKPSLSPAVAADLPPAYAPTLNPEPLDAPAPTRTRPKGPCGGVEVRLITSSEDPAWSFASIAPGPQHPASLRRVGDTVGPWRIAGIDWDRVWLTQGTTRCSAGMNAGTDQPPVLVGVDDGNAPALVAADDGAPVWAVPADVAAGISKRSETELVIDPVAVRAIFSKGADLFAGLQVDPVLREEQVVGVSLDAIPPDSLLDRLGIAQGDIVLRIDDRPIDTLDAAIAALVDMKDRAQIQADIERGGETFRLELRVQ